MTSSFFFQAGPGNRNKIFFHGVMIIISAISDFQEEDGMFDVIKGMVGEVKMYWEGFICVVLYSSSMFSETFSWGASSLSNVL